jgi:RNA polymerase sigma-70 factor (ECF subfamily)
VLTASLDRVDVLRAAFSGFAPARGAFDARGARLGSVVRGAASTTILPRVSAARMDPSEERELVRRAKFGDRAALGTILRWYGPILYRAVLLPRLGSAAAAQDALGETYARVVERFAQFEWQDCGVYPWLRVVALRLALDQLRAKKRETLFEPDDLVRELDRAEREGASAPDVEVLEARDRATARDRVESALAKLNPRYALVIRLRVLEERSREEAALALDVTVATLDVVLHRAMTSLRKVLAGVEEAAE